MREVLDLPVAYSVVLGLISLEVAREVDQASSKDRPTEGSTAVYRYDASFRDAVDAGTLTPRQALERGSRKSYAKRLVKLHGLTVDDAYSVTDGRISLIDAMRRRKVVDRVSARPLQRFDLKLFLVGMLGCLALLLLAGELAERRSAVRAARVAPRLVEEVVGTSLDGRGSETTARGDVSGETFTAAWPGSETFGPLRAAARIETDDDGLITRIEAADPATVLELFCDAAILLEPIGVVETIPRSPSHKLGLIRDAGDFEQPRTLAIRRDPETRRWFAGDGQAPLDAHAASAAVLATLP